jgi:hypothetical protein
MVRPATGLQMMVGDIRWVRVRVRESSKRMIEWLGDHCSHLHMLLLDWLGGQVRMMSYGFSDKENAAGNVGRYGVGFKSGSMRLGQDALVISKSIEVCLPMQACKLASVGRVRRRRKDFSAPELFLLVELLSVNPAHSSVTLHLLGEHSPASPCTGRKRRKVVTPATVWSHCHARLAAQGTATVALLSRTFLDELKVDEIMIPMFTWTMHESAPTPGQSARHKPTQTFERLAPANATEWSRNLQVLKRFSPLDGEDALLDALRALKSTTGTAVWCYNMRQPAELETTEDNITIVKVPQPWDALQHASRRSLRIASGPVGSHERWKGRCLQGTTRMRPADAFRLASQFK